jgi:hypothetical protein
MSFLKHSSCPSCGSKDNLANYSDGSKWCFGCHYYQRGDVSPLIKEREDGEIEELDDRRRMVELYERSSEELDGRATIWLSKYQTTATDWLRAKLRWNAYWEQLLIPLFDNDGQLCCIQAKNFNTERAKKAKYYNIGDKSLSCTTFGVGTTLVLCEDVVSSLRIGATTASMPLLGTSIAKERLAALKGLYTELVVWLDADKWKEATVIAQQAQLLGFTAKAVFTENDPKEYSDKEIYGSIYST